MEPIFWAAHKAEWSAPHTNPLRPFLLHVHGLPTDPPALRFHVTDFHSKTWEALKTEARPRRHVAQKAKGMPRITILLTKLVDAAASEAVANLSLELYKSLKNEKNETIQKQLDGFLYPKRQKLTKVTDKSKSDSASIMDSQNSPDGKAAQQPSTKVINRVVPTRRRAKIRGVLLQDTEDDAQN
nr:Leucine-rich repeat-containing protein [Ipomoea batatas]